ncbi:putative dolichyl-P-Man:GDP-Man5GlcNAc2-PP-dolichyl alpha-1,2-mannosyltransferase [Trypanosoma rangeli]|uniref:Mannosyltransferase n=1 Tax=Trypanosoma rangeli TaxID=5698 RepID=A0A422NUF2_TRYRA|nr:putative dolichyl-P-Man:GDP-Man5GlcNAc2-PP-dolichyl alpha-1,2-mannosyltransferase [Trypanosoma rangeli]RNF09078.1 putative dolichyl-P-Man:GDP-Man5GlcNAc2-PP-dolichyl alpha-1,2-mannosyltransferase [Trypanosoma rangeli]|eukprot:RNF09078.1 putative dolichyl-P-Man:GDP-Man5GlcNAc2-PP-dolichyl alpha-1,2-mannosyltransferase [Trypanosoma rangeli]
MRWFLRMLRFGAAFILLSLGHYFAARFLPVADCDETFNFVEPMHQLLYGSGLQTWENCPRYALRSWLFAWIYASPALLVIGAPRLRNVDVYFFNRIFYGRLACLSELFLVYSVWEAVSGRAAAVTLLLLLFNYPVPHAAVSALPTSFVMINYFMALGCWLRSGRRNVRHTSTPARQSQLQQTETNYFSVFGAVFFVVFACAVVWPFAGFAVLPVALDLLMRHPKASILSLLVSLALILPLAVGFDALYYCRLTWSAWNLVRYNLKGGAELYGVEPWYYFVKNLLVNAPALFLAGALAPFVLFLSPALDMGQRNNRKHKEGRGVHADTSTVLQKHAAQSSFPSFCSLTSAKALVVSVSTALSSSTAASSSLSRSRMLLWVSPFFVWFTFWLTVAHKEERFMAPVYPFLVLAAALSLTCVFFSPRSALNTRTGTKTTPKRHAQVCVTPSRKTWLLPAAGCILLLLSGLLSFSRGLAVYHFYAGPQRLMYDNYDVLQHAAEYKRVANANAGNATTLHDLYTVCVGREWYRFPSSFFLDPQRARVAFLKTDAFAGALPLPFTRHGGHATCNCGASGVNDLNEEIAEQYVSDAAVECDVILDSHSADDLRELKDYPPDVFAYPLGTTQQRLLDVARTSMWCRVLYYPFGISERCAVWRRVELLSKHRPTAVAAS